MRRQFAIQARRFPSGKPTRGDFIYGIHETLGPHTHPDSRYAMRFGNEEDAREFASRNGIGLLPIGCQAIVSVEYLAQADQLMLELVPYRTPTAQTSNTLMNCGHDSSYEVCGRCEDSRGVEQDFDLCTLCDREHADADE